MAIKFLAANGSNSNSGDSELLPWLTVAHANANLVGGDTIRARRGDIWREMWDLAAAGSTAIIVEDYGSGPLPSFRGSNLGASWAFDSGNIWFISVASDPNMVWFNEVRGTEELSKAALTTANEWFFSSGEGRLYVFSTSDPDTAYTAPGIQYGARNSALDTGNRNNVTYRRLNFKHGRGQSAGVGVVWIESNPQNITVEFCEVQECFAFGISTTGAASSNVHIHDNLVEGCGDSGMTMNQNDNLDYHIYRNFFRFNGWRIDTGGGLTSRLKSGEVYENECQENGIGFSGTGKNHGIYNDRGSHPVDAADVQIFLNVCYDQPNGSGIVCKSSAHVRDNLCYTNSHDGITMGEVNSGVLVTVWIYRNVFVNNGKFGISQNLPPITGTMAFKAYHNVIYGGERSVSIDDDHTSIDMRNNIFAIPAGGSSVSPVRFATAQSALTCNFNLYFYVSTSPVSYNGAVQSWAAWQALGHEANGIDDTDPLFVAPNSGGDGDYHLQGASPAINAGVAIAGINDDFNGPAPDIGAFETGTTTFFQSLAATAVGVAVMVPVEINPTTFFKSLVAVAIGVPTLSQVKLNIPNFSRPLRQPKRGRRG